MITFEESILMTIYFAKYWARVESGTDTTTSSKESFHIANGLLYRNGKVCVPDLLDVKKRIPFECHDAPSVGHPGIHRTLILISTQFYWLKMRPDIHSYVTKCHQCQVNKAERLKPLDFYILWTFPIISGKVYPWIL